MTKPRRMIGWVTVAATFVHGCAQEPTEIPTGKDLYTQHCASCHGSSGHGDGAVAQSLRTLPTDLTRLAERSGGSFDEARIMAIIDGRQLVAAHGVRDMPVWGVVFPEQSIDQKAIEYPGDRRTRALIDHLRSMQRR